MTALPATARAVKRCGGWIVSASCRFCVVWTTVTAATAELGAARITTAVANNRLSRRAQLVCSAAVRSRRMVPVCGVLAAVFITACGGGQRQDASEPNHKYTVQVTTASFPASQRLSEHTHLVLAV